MHLQLKPGLVVLPLSNTSVQIGIAPGPTYRLHELSPSMYSFVSLLTASHTWSQLLDGSGLDESVATGLRNQLANAGLLTMRQHSSTTTQDRDRLDRARLHHDSAAWSLANPLADSRDIMNRRSNAWVEIHGSGRLAFGLGQLLAAAGVGRITATTSRALTEQDCAPLGPLPEHCGQPSHRALMDLLSSHYPSVHRASRAHEPPDVTVIASESPFVPLALCDELVSQDRVHLPVVSRGGGFVLGPFVVPGQSACVRCDELIRSDRDATHAWIATAMRTDPSPPQAFDAVLGTLATSYVALNTLAYIDQLVTPQLLNTVGTTTLPAGELTVTATTPHPACGCGWPQSERF